MKLPSVLFALAITTLTTQAADSKIAGQAVNALGIDLHRTLEEGDANLLI